MKKFVLLIAIAILTSSPAAAYVGPGLGLNVIGMVIGLCLAIFMLFLGTIWYPLKSAWKSFRKRPTSPSEVAETNDNGPNSP